MSFKKKVATVTYASGRTEKYKPKNFAEEAKMKADFAKLDGIKSVKWEEI